MLYVPLKLGPYVQTSPKTEPHVESQQNAPFLRAEDILFRITRSHYRIFFSISVLPNRIWEKLTHICLQTNIYANRLQNIDETFEVQSKSQL